MDDNMLLPSIKFVIAVYKTWPCTIQNINSETEVNRMINIIRINAPVGSVWNQCV